MAPKPLSNIMSIEPYKGGLSKTGNNQKVIKLSSNETPLGASPKAIEAFKQSASNLQRYPDGGATKIRQAIGSVYGLDPDRLVCGAGSDEIITFICQAYAGVGDEIMYTEHGFLMYPIAAKVVGATAVKVKETDLRADIDAILAAVTERTKIIFLANPNNPTGSYVTKAELERLIDGLPDNILLVLDGAYAEYVSKADYTAGIDLVDANDNVVITRTFSKIYGLAALRLGWAYAPDAVIDALNRVRGPFNVSMPAIEAGVAAIEDTAFVEQARNHNDIWLGWFGNECEKLGLKPYPSIANFVLVGFPQGQEHAHAAYEALMAEGVIVRKVDNYGLPDCLRVTIGLEDENKAVVSILASFLGK